MPPVAEDRHRCRRLRTQWGHIRAKLRFPRRNRFRYSCRRKNTWLPSFSCRPAPGNPAGIGKVDYLTVERKALPCLPDLY
jgi:hypothetical protein